MYAEAQKLDGLPDAEEGTTVRAAAEALVARGLIAEYRWVWSVAEAVIALQTTPLSFGSNWYEGMDEPDSMGYARVTGECLGGHAYVIDGVALKGKYFRCKNSWGREWGKSGFFKLSFEDAERLIDESGELCAYIETE